VTFLIGFFSCVKLTLSLDISWNNSNLIFFSENGEVFPVNEPEIMILLSSLFKLALFVEEQKRREKNEKNTKNFQKAHNRN